MNEIYYLFPTALGFLSSIFIMRGMNTLSNEIDMIAYAETSKTRYSLNSTLGSITI